MRTETEVLRKYVEKLKNLHLLEAKGQTEPREEQQAWEESHRRDLQLLDWVLADSEEDGDET